MRTTAIIGGVVAVFAGTYPVAFGLHAVQSSAVSLLCGSVAAAYRFAQRHDERSSVARGGVAVFTGQDPVDRRMLRGRHLQHRAERRLDRRVTSSGAHIAFFGSPIPPLSGAVAVQSLSEQLVNVHALRAAGAVTVVSCRITGVGLAVTYVGDVVADISGIIATIGKPVAAYQHAHPPFGNNNDSRRVSS